MTIQDRILAYLSQHPEGVDDDMLATALNLKQRQQANQRCRRLEQFGTVARRRVDGKIRNFLHSERLLPSPPEQGSESACDERPWYWEGHVQAKVVQYLTGLGYRVDSTADTATKEQGKDIVAIAPDGQTLWVSAKGYPRGTVRTPPGTQARHWFAHAVFDLVRWHGEDRSVALALALPDYPSYKNRVPSVAWFLDELGASIFWVKENGKVVEESFRARGVGA